MSCIGRSNPSAPRSILRSGTQWSKKILERSASPEVAFETTLRINNRFFLDGRDANSFTNVAWVYGLHDRPWGGRPVLGRVRYLGPNTLRKAISAP